jgi:hypothetical protein
MSTAGATTRESARTIRQFPNFSMRCNEADR